LVLLVVGIGTHFVEQGGQHQRGWSLSNPFASHHEGPFHYAVHIMLLTATVLLCPELLPRFWLWLRTVSTKSRPSVLDHIRGGVLFMDSASIAQYRAHEISTFLPILLQIVLSIPPALQWQQQRLFSNILRRVASDESLTQCFQCFIAAERDRSVRMTPTTTANPRALSIAARLDQISRSDPALHNLWTKLSATAFHGGTCRVHEYFYSIYRHRPSQRNSDGKIPVPSKRTIYDPIDLDSKEVLSSVEVLKVMASNARPILVQCWSTPSSCCRGTGSPRKGRTLLLKNGDDLRKDRGVLLMFRLMNDIWRTEGVQYRGIDVQSFVYSVVPMAAEFGAIECVEQCIKISDLQSSEAIQRDIGRNVDRLLASAVGSYLCSYVVGVRDRHHDNILIQREEGILFHIDFAYILGEKIMGLDAAKVAISPALVQVLGEQKWMDFIESVKRSFAALRKHRDEVIEFGRMAFGYGYDDDRVRGYLSKALCVGDSDAKATEFIAEKFLKSPHKFQTKMKNAIHDIAVRRIST